MHKGQVPKPHEQAHSLINPLISKLKLLVLSISFSRAMG